MFEIDETYPVDLLHGVFAKLATTGACEGPIDLYAEGMADFYDAFMTEYVSDIPFFERYFKGGRILDLASGSGRITFQLARAGHDVDGLELSPSMLALAQEHLALEAPEVAERIRFFQGDMRMFDLDEKYDMIILGVTSISLLLQEQDRIDLFKCVAKHLVPDGIFIFDILDFENERWRKFDHFIDFWTVPTKEEFDFGLVGQRIFPKEGRFIFNVLREIGHWDGTVDRRLGVSEKALLFCENLRRELSFANLHICEMEIEGDQRFIFVRHDET